VAAKRYIDSAEILGALTPDEFDDLQSILAAVADFTDDYFGNVAIARDTLLEAMNVLRHIGFLPCATSRRVLEIGAGSGCLGAGLMLKGYSYASTDFTQQSYLYQNRFFTHLCEGRLVDGVLNGAAPAELLTYIPKGGGVHLPWWQFAELTPEEMPAFDIVICSQAPAEMYLRLAQAALSKSDDPHRTCIFHDCGQSGDHDRVSGLFSEFGFRLDHSDHALGFFVPADAPRNSLSRAIADGLDRIRDHQYVAIDQFETLCTVILASA
jgi:hypothetical protein